MLVGVAMVKVCPQITWHFSPLGKGHITSAWFYHEIARLERLQIGVPVPRLAQLPDHSTILEVTVQRNLQRAALARI